MCEFGACDGGPEDWTHSKAYYHSKPCNFIFGNCYSPVGILLARGLAYLKSHPVTLSANEIGAGQITYQYSTKSLCVNVGAGASFPPSKAFTVGVLNAGDMGNWQDVESSWGYSFGANLFAGYQGSFNSSGKVGGPTVSGIGISGSYTWGGCTSF